ncbi:sigma factor-like helix-turn-helix DNA-binding protein [Streptomyces sp. NPDC058623]|uniref:sigma-70 region 4 domain-containing protein n=1 Tax=Streptomyces sp. NPDC058623 TaxID=3346563 RepID=UPI003649E86B
MVEHLLQLPSKQRAALAWNLDGFTTEETARAMGTTQTAVRQNLSRARAALKASLGLHKRLRRGRRTGGSIMSTDPLHDHDGPADFLAALLASAHKQVGTAVIDRLSAQGGVPELRDLDLALDRMLWSAHRATGSEVAERLARDGPRSRHSSPRMAAPGPLAGRVASVRLKHRREALRLAHAYWPTDFTAMIRRALMTLGELSELIEADELQAGDAWEEIIGVTLLLKRELAQIMLPAFRGLPRPGQPGTDYLTEVEQFPRLACGTAAAGPRQCSAASDGRARLPPRRLGDGRRHCWARTWSCRTSPRTWSRHTARRRPCGWWWPWWSGPAVTSWGEELSQANLDHIPLKGVRWDAGTVWPDEWEAWIRQASRPAGGEEGVLIIASEPHSSVVSADA